jgi:hypothetical protein
MLEMAGGDRRLFELGASRVAQRNETIVEAGIEFGEIDSIINGN